MILANTQQNSEEDSVNVHVLPAILVGFDELADLKSYINSTTSQRAKFYKHVIAPGLTSLLLGTQNLGPIGLPEDTKSVNFSVMP
ncbi:subtilisin-like protease SDD1-like, partial [Trifolium medium]|nr:subtilisin-like protease SDD1-like [Trifolium medium]